MAERIVSPAVFTNEIDQTFLTQGIQQIGGAVVGPFNRGPAFAPTVIRNQGDLEDLFGIPEGEYYQPFTAREYLHHQGVVTIVRTGSLGGYVQKNALIITATVEEKDCLKYEQEYLRIHKQPAPSGSCDAIEVGEKTVIGVLANTLYQTTHGVTPVVNNEGFEGSEVLPATNLMYYDRTELADKTVIVDANLSSTLKLRTTDDGVVKNVKYDIHKAPDPNNPDANRIVSDYVFSIDPRDPDSLQNIFGRAPKQNIEPAYFHAYFENAQTTIYNNIQYGVRYRIECDTEVGGQTIEQGELAGAMTFQREVADTSEGDGMILDDSPYGMGTGKYSCRPANTPWIQSQEISGRRYDLFRVWTRNMGTSANREIKVAISDVRTPGSIQGSDYGTFDLLVRGFMDNDKNQNIIESYDNVSLDPSSARYLPRVVGDRLTTIDNKGKLTDHGDYANSSNWIRIEMNPDSVAPSQAMPYGHGSYFSTVGGVTVPTAIYSHVSQYGRNPGRFYNGAVFNQDSPDGILELPFAAKDTNELFSPLPAGSDDTGEGYYMDQPGSYVEEIDGETERFEVGPIDTSPSLANETTVAKTRRFVVGFQGGFDGHAPTHPINLGKDITAHNVQGMDCSKRFSTGTKAYFKAFAALSNQDEFDINLLVTPGLTLDLHRAVINRGVDLCESREDAFYILDCVSAHDQPGRVDDAISEASTIDSNYAATYYPWIKIIDPATNKLQPFPPSSLMASVYAANDKVSAEWFAPAGLNRGGLEQAVSVMDRLNFAERDDLYEGKVNPIAAFPGQGIVAFGQKTLQRRASALDRINVRRLLITVKKFIASSARYLIFEQNVTATRQRFLSIVNPYLENVQQRHGLYAFRVIMDESNNTPDLIDRNILYGQIFLQPARAVEFIVLDFTLQSTGASFEG
jgi:hypothetical protein